MRALESAIASEFNLATPVTLGDIDWAGRTDGWIAEVICDKIGIHHTPGNVDRLLSAYVAQLPGHLDARTEVLPGVREILAHAHHHPDFQLGLLTGNMKIGARTKLGHFGLWDYFPFGAFADDSARRNDLGPHAVRRATAHTGRTFAPEDIWIIGDTPHDIECGKVIGARTLAVATGRHSLPELAAGSPDALVDTFSPAAKFWQAVGN